MAETVANTAASYPIEVIFFTIVAATVTIVTANVTINIIDVTIMDSYMLQ